MKRAPRAPSPLAPLPHTGEGNFERLPPAVKPEGSVVSRHATFMVGLALE